MELGLVTALTAANITVLQPSHIQQEDKPVDVPYLFVRLTIAEHVQNIATIKYASPFHFTLCCDYCTTYTVDQLHFLYDSIITGQVCKNHFFEHV